MIVMIVIIIIIVKTITITDKYYISGHCSRQHVHDIIWGAGGWGARGTCAGWPGGVVSINTTTTQVPEAASESPVPCGD